MDLAEVILKVPDFSSCWRCTRVHWHVFYCEGFNCLQRIVNEVDTILGELGCCCSFVPDNEDFLQSIVLMLPVKCTHPRLES